MSYPAKPTLADFARLASSGSSITVATRDESFIPALSRCAAARLRNDGMVLVAVAMPEGERAIANIDTNHLVSLTCALPTTYEAIQLKGSDARRATWPDAAMAADEHQRLFIRQVNEVGMTTEVGRAIWSRAWIAIEFTPTEMRNQTPGVRA